MSAQASLVELADFTGQSSGEVVSIDFFTVSTIAFKVMFVFVVLAHERRRLVQLNVTEHSMVSWRTTAAPEAVRSPDSPRVLKTWPCSFLTTPAPLKVLAFEVGVPVPWLGTPRANDAPSLAERDESEVG